MTRIAIIFFVWVFLLLASGGGLTRANDLSFDATVEQVDTDTMECFNYEIVSNKMFQLQSDLLLAKGKYKKLRIENQINKLRPSVINREVLCL